VLDEVLAVVGPGKPPLLDALRIDDDPLTFEQIDDAVVRQRQRVVRQMGRPAKRGELVKLGLERVDDVLQRDRRLLTPAGNELELVGSRPRRHAAGNRGHRVNATTTDELDRPLADGPDSEQGLGKLGVDGKQREDVALVRRCVDAEDDVGTGENEVGQRM